MRVDESQRRQSFVRARDPGHNRGSSPTDEPKGLTKKQKKQLKKKLKKKQKKLIEQNKILEEKIEEYHKGILQNMSAGEEEQDDPALSTSERLLENEPDGYNPHQPTQFNKAYNFDHYNEPEDEEAVFDKNFRSTAHAFEEDISKVYFEKFQQIRWFINRVNHYNLVSSFKKDPIQQKGQQEYSLKETRFGESGAPKAENNSLRTPDFGDKELLQRALLELASFTDPHVKFRSKSAVTRFEKRPKKDYSFLGRRSKSLPQSAKRFSETSFNQLDNINISKVLEKYLNNLTGPIDKENSLADQSEVIRFGSEHFMKIDDEFFKTYLQSSAELLRQSPPVSSTVLSSLMR